MGLSRGVVVGSAVGIGTPKGEPGQHITVVSIAGACAARAAHKIMKISPENNLPAGAAFVQNALAG
jgi:hypothetical protein